MNTHSDRKHSTLGFYGGAGSVTGANFLLDTGDLKILVDCGFVQGGKFVETRNHEPFAYDPRSIDVLLVTHAHADHIGRIPKLVRDGFKGVVYSTTPTKELAAVMFEDALSIMRHEADVRREEPLYDKNDVLRALSLWHGVAYGVETSLGKDIVCRLRDAGHILGSAFIEVTRGEKTIVFSGDIGNVPQPLLNPPDIPSGYHYLIMESVYGDRVHEDVAERGSMLLSHIERTITQKGTLIIPAFSLERTQGMLYEINNLVESGVIPPVATFLDSPLAIKVTELYRKHVAYLKESVRAQIKSGDDIFDFPKLSFTRTVADSREIARTPGPKIIIAGSGMSHGGRILAHEKEYLDNPNATLLLVGFQAVGSIGRMLQDGVRNITIDGTHVNVKARVATIRGYSGHTDRDGLIEFVEKGGEKIEKVFVTMGEEHAALFLVQRLRDYLGIDATAPGEGSVVSIEF